MKARLLEFDVKDFLQKEKNNYLENIKAFKKQKRFETLMIMVELFITSAIIFFVAYFSYFNGMVTPAIGTIMIGVSLIIILKRLTLNKLSFSSYPSKKYEFQFIEAVFEKKEIISAEIVYDTILLSHSLKVLYGNDGFNQEYSDIEVDIQKCNDIDELWYDLRCNRLYVPYEKYDLIKNHLCIEVDTSFTCNKLLFDVIKNPV